TMRHATTSRASGHFLSLPQERNRNCEETCQGAGPLARLLPAALDRTFAVPVHPTTMEAKEENRKIGSIPPFGDTEPGMSPQPQSPTSDLSSHQSGHPFPVGSEIERLVGADTAAEFL